MPAEGSLPHSCAVRIFLSVLRVWAAIAFLRAGLVRLRLTFGLPPSFPFLCTAANFAALPAQAREPRNPCNNVGKQVSTSRCGK
jgi:hypothetical protein